MGIRPKELNKLGYTNDVARSLALNIIQKHYKHSTEEEIKGILTDLAENPEKYKENPIWHKLAEHLSPSSTEQTFTTYELSEQVLAYPMYGEEFIESLAQQQMNLAMQLPVAIAGALMPDAHAGYGLPIGGVLATESAVIPYAVGLDIGCRMSLSVLDAKTDYIKRYTHQIKEALLQQTHFGMEGGLPFKQEHEVLERKEFQATPLLKTLHRKAARQLGSSGSGNHFVEFGELALEENNILNLPAGSYLALLSHSGSRGLGAAIALQYSQIAREQCHLPRKAQNLAWLDINSSAGEEYWMSMNLAGDFAKACHERIHSNLSKALGLKPLANTSNHHNFAWKEEISPGKYAIVHRKGATPAGKGISGFIPGSMATAGYLVCGKGEKESLNSASHGAGRTMSRQEAKGQITNSALKKRLTETGVTLIGGSVEESPYAYKNIDQVMKAQETLIEIHGKFMPRIVRMNNE